MAEKTKLPSTSGAEQLAVGLADEPSCQRNVPSSAFTPITPCPVNCTYCRTPPIVATTADA